MEFTRQLIDGGIVHVCRDRGQKCHQGGDRNGPSFSTFRKNGIGYGRLILCHNISLLQRKSGLLVATNSQGMTDRVGKVCYVEDCSNVGYL